MDPKFFSVLKRSVPIGSNNPQFYRFVNLYKNRGILNRRVLRIKHDFGSVLLFTI